MSDITVIIPFFNEEETLRQTMEMLIKQTLKPKRIIMIDSGSTDKSASIINEYMEKRDNSIELVQPMLRSPSSSINYGIRNIITRYVAYIDCGLLIPINWLESQYKKIKKNNYMIVSAQIYTKGTNALDKSLVAQTYGYKNITTCLPGSLIDMNIFKIIGMLKENMRAGYDIDFINRINKKGINRIINRDICLKYLGINYANNYVMASKKIFNYSLTGWETMGDCKPYIYIILMFIIFLSIAMNIFLELAITYIIIRGYLIPITKSKKLLQEKNIYFYLMLPISAIIFDISRLCGYLFAIKKYFVTENK